MPVDATQTEDTLVGRTIAERYRVLAPIGRGGMGAVYRVEHLMLKKELALKFLHPELGRLDEVARRFEREAEAAARLDHPNIVQVTDFGRTAEGMLFLVMELLQGDSLTAVIRPDGVGTPIPVERALHIERQILRALEHAHASGIVHRDLKPDNVMLIKRDDEVDIVKLLDFGIAKLTLADGEVGKGETLTQAGVVFGTPEYLSPEQAMGEEADRRADLYSAGIVLYEMLAGRRPFDAASKVAIVSMHLTQKAMPVTQAAPDANIPRWLERVVERAMAKKRDERYSDAQEFLQALDWSAGPSRGLPVVSGSPSAGIGRLGEAVLDRVATAWSFLVRRGREAGVPWPRAFAAAGVALAVALVGLVVIMRRTDGPRPAPPAMADSLGRAESLLAHGELEGARAALQQLQSAHPETARVHYLMGNLDYAQGERERALGDYQRAIQLDRGYKTDPVLRGNVRAMLDRRTEGQAAVALLADDIGKPALADLVACAKGCRDDRVRRRAAEAAVKIGGPALIAEEGRPLGKDDDALLDKLRNGKSCRERKAAALELIATGDKTYLDSLRAARERKGGLFGLEGINGCMRRELDAAIRKLDGDKDK
ncbi:MAG: serine/threonine protein kinase with repeat [Myxococcales bacterium]|nr:serine/threonine protein kinase with repeat [Myxococcales bacterium]